jgi:hypothetical protein
VCVQVPCVYLLYAASSVTERNKYSNLLESHKHAGAGSKKEVYLGPILQLCCPTNIFSLMFFFLLNIALASRCLWTLCSVPPWGFASPCTLVHAGPCTAAHACAFTDDKVDKRRASHWHWSGIVLIGSISKDG